MKRIADNPYANRGDTDKQTEALDQVALPLRRLAEDIATLIRTHGLREAAITIDGPENISGTISLQGTMDGVISVAISGNAGTGSPTHPGTPYYASYSGEFFWQPTPDSSAFVKSGDRVKSGTLVAWAMGESKDMSFGLRAETAGVIHLIAPNASKVREGETLLFSIEERDE